MVRENKLKLHRLSFTGLLAVVCALLPQMAHAARASAPAAVNASVESDAPEKSLIVVTLKSQLSSQFLDDRLTRSQLFKLSGGGMLTHEFSEHFGADLDLGVYFTRGNATSLLPDEDKPTQGFSLTEAAIRYNAQKVFIGRAGVVDQSRHSPKILVSQVGMPGAEENLELGERKGGLALLLVGSQAIPTSDNTTVRTPPGADSKMPIFLTERVSLIREDRGALESWKLSALHYRFSNLSPSTAQSSRFRGNTVTGLGESAARFSYGFEGLGGGAEAALRLAAPVRLMLVADAIQNTQAPSGRNRATSAQAGLEILTGKKAKDPVITPSFTVFRAESDAAPAAYGSSLFGYSNRSGYLAGAKLDLPGDGVVVGAQWMNAKPISVSPYQSDRQLIYLSLEVRHGVL